MKARLQQIINTRRWEQAVIAVIVLNAITLGLETDERVMARAGGVMHALDRIILAVFAAELGLRIYAFRLSFFKEGWNLFDFVIVAIALIPASGPFAVLRSLRILRLLRLVSTVPSLRKVVSGLLAALPGMGSIMLLMLLVFYVGAVMATNLYGPAFPEWFGTLQRSFYTLFQIMTLDSWSMGIVRPILEVHPYAWAFFIPFVLCTAFAVLNLLIGVIVSAMQSETEALAEADRQALQSETEVVLAEVRALRREVVELRASLEGPRP